ncbi:PAS domain S-box protein [Bacteroidota bacterium]
MMDKNLSFDQSEFLDLLPEIVFEIDADLNVRFLNQACERILGYSKSEMLNHKLSLQNFVAPHDLERVKSNLKKNFTGNHVSGNCYQVFTKTKEELTLEIYNNHIKKNGNVIGLRCIAIDITEKEKNHNVLSTQEKHFRQIFQNYPVPYQSLNSEGIIIDVNPEWIDLMGYSRSEIIGKKFTTLLSDENKNRFNKAFEIFKKKGIVNNIQFDLIKKDGNTININYHGRIEHFNNKYIRSHCVFSDITLQRKAEETLIRSEQRLRELNATKDKFFSIIAHDLKNPFNDLMGFTQLLALNIDKYDKSKIEQFTQIIHQSSKLAYNLLENLLDWSRSQTGILKFKPEKICINNLVKENIDLLISTAQNKNIKIYSEFDNDLFAFADKNMVRTIIRNLISNAIKYTNQGGYVKINSYCNNKCCELSVSDNGIGISEKNISKIFKIDESFSTSGTEKEKGTGLGLILCKEFVEKNRGKLKVESKPDKGSTFSFTLPLPEPEY